MYKHDNIFPIRQAENKAMDNLKSFHPLDCFPAQALSVNLKDNNRKNRRVTQRERKSKNCC